MARSTLQTSICKPFGSARLPDIIQVAFKVG
jgi:hypothetical protein